MDFNIYVPSYHRYDNILTQDILEYCTYVVRQSEEQLYKDAGVKNIIAVEDEKINSATKVMNWIIENTKEPLICIIDDDIQDCIYRLDNNVNIGKDKEIITSEIERIAQLFSDLKIGYGAIDVTSRPFGYTQEFTFKGISGPIRWVNKEVYKAKFDQDVEYSGDVDVVLQELLRNRIVLKPLYLCAKTKVDLVKGGNQVNKLRRTQLIHIERMKQKWGNNFVYDYDKNTPHIKVKR